MKALSIKQPWAWAILNGKPVENRTWPTRFTGPFLIHASKTFDNDGYYWIMENHLALFKGPITMPGPKRFEMGGVVGKARMVDCVDSHNSPWFFGPRGFVIENAEPLPFYPCKGALGFFDIEYTPDTKKEKDDGY